MLADYLTLCLQDPSSAWKKELVQQLATTSVPGVIFQDKESLLKHDVQNLWARWFIESLHNPKMTADLSFSQAYTLTLNLLDRTSSSTPADERKQSAGKIARLLVDVASRKRSLTRESIRKSDRELLLEKCSKPQTRCSICGYQFTERIRDAFLRGAAQKGLCPDFIDCVRPWGLRERDSRIEIDHEVPVHDGGDTQISNLTLTCGWCNKAKSSAQSIYDRDPSPALFHHPRLGELSRPIPIWIVRLLALRRRCEDPSGCQVNTSNGQLYVFISNLSGTANPLNLSLRCEEHDTFRDSRFIARKHFT